MSYNREDTVKFKKTEKRRMIMLLIFILVLISTCIIGICACISTNVYQDEDEFRQYADSCLDVYEITDSQSSRNVSYEYGTPISYAVDYAVCENRYIASFEEEKLNEIKASFSEASEAAETVRKNTYDQNGEYRPLERALIVRTDIYESDSGITNLAIYESHNVENGKKMQEAGTAVYTYQFSQETGLSMVPQQIFDENYREKCSEYFTDYFTRNYKDEELAEGWQKYVSASEENYNKYVVTDSGVTFFFDEGTVLDRSQGVVHAGISEMEMSGFLREEIIERYIDPSRPMVAITYDDGPGGECERRIIDCLRKNGAVATFFYLGSRVGSNPENAKAAYDMGCEIGNHTWGHPILTKLNESDLKKQLADTNEIIKSVCGAYPTLFRPSYGITNDKINSISGMPVIMWSVDTLDWKKRDGRKVFEYVSGMKDLDGKIILMHSIYDSTADATELLVPWLRENGYQMVTVSELIRYKQGAEPQAGSVYRLF